MKRFIIALLGSLLCIYLVHLIFFDNAYTLKSLSNAFFIVGLVMFFLSLIAISNAKNLFLVVSYSFKSFFKRHDSKHKSYYDYASDNRKKGISPFALQIFIISIGILTISFVLAQFVMNI